MKDTDAQQLQQKGLAILESIAKILADLPATWNEHNSRQEKIRFVANRLQKLYSYETAEIEGEI